MSDLLHITRGSTWRLPIAVLNRVGVPVSFLESSGTLTPDNGSPAPIELTQLNGKLLMPAFIWRGRWDAAVNYVIGDVVNLGDEYYQASVDNLNANPSTNGDWSIFSQLEILVPEGETDGFTWSDGKLCIDVREGSGDKIEGYVNQRVKIVDPC